MSIRILTSYVWNCASFGYLISYVWNISILVFYVDIDILCPEPPVLVFIWTLTSYLYTVSFLPKCLHLDIEILYPTFVTPICYILDIDIR